MFHASFKAWNTLWPAVSKSGTTSLLWHLAKRRFGAEAAGQLAGQLAGMDTDRLIEVGDWMLECRTAGELLDRLNHKD